MKTLVYHHLVDLIATVKSLMITESVPAKKDTLAHHLLVGQSV